MANYKRAPWDFSCPYQNRCPHLGEQAARGVFAAYHRANEREREHHRIRDEMAAEIDALHQTMVEQAAETDRLRAENRRLHLKAFKANKTPRNGKDKGKTGSGKTASDTPKTKKKRGAPKGHPPWPRKEPEHIDHTVKTDAPCTCPHCQQSTDTSKTDTTTFVQEDIVLRPQTVVTRFVHETAWCPNCRQQVYEQVENELPFAPIGPNAKAAALYLRHELKLPYRKIQQAMGALFGIDFVPASTLGFEKRARDCADAVYDDLIGRMRASTVVHADETHWRQDGKNHYVWYAGNEQVALFHVDPRRSSEAAQVLLGDRLEGLLVADAYAAYNIIKCQARQSCLAHLIRAADDLGKELDEMKNPDPASRRFCRVLADFFRLACRITIPASSNERAVLCDHFLRALNLICEKPLAFAKAETLRKRLLPGAREYDEVFTFILHGGPPTNNHAERALRPLVIFRKVCMGTRSPTGSANIGIFSSLTQTAKLQDADPLQVLFSLLTASPLDAHNAIFMSSA